MKPSPYLKRAGQAVFKDRYVNKLSELLTDWNEGEQGSLAIIGAPLSKPSISHSGSLMAPTAIRRCLQSFTTFSIEKNIDLKNEKWIDFGDVLMHPTDLNACHDRISDGVSYLLDQKAAPLTVVLGGDHSISFPSIKAFHQKRGTIGVIQFDAHHDLRNLEDGGPSNGTPFRNLIENGVIKGEHLVQIGIRDFMNSPEYKRYADEEGVTVYTMEDVREKGIVSIVQKAYEQLLGKVDMLYLSVDLDVLDQAFAPGCPAIGPGGMDSETLKKGVEWLASKEQVKAMDLVEIDPTLDFRDMTSRVAAHLIASFMKAKR
jgi:formiminoglutamase